MGCAEPLGWMLLFGGGAGRGRAGRGWAHAGYGGLVVFMLLVFGVHIGGGVDGVDLLLLLLLQSLEPTVHLVFPVDAKLKQL